MLLLQKIVGKTVNNLLALQKFWDNSMKMLQKTFAVCSNFAICVRNWDIGPVATLELYCECLALAIHIYVYLPDGAIFHTIGTSYHFELYALTIAWLMWIFDYEHSWITGSCWRDGIQDCWKEYTKIERSIWTICRASTVILNKKSSLTHWIIYTDLATQIKISYVYLNVVYTISCRRRRYI